jgi:ABC-2 type transport system ATP-binding protein
MVAPFGASLHVSGADRPALERAIAPYRNEPDLVWRQDEPTLEDVFILMMKKTPDNFQ